MLAINDVLVIDLDLRAEMKQCNLTVDHMILPKILMRGAALEVTCQQHISDFSIRRNLLVI
jgi:hypothetical protein